MDISSNRGSWLTFVELLNFVGTLSSKQFDQYLIITDILSYLIMLFYLLLILEKLGLFASVTNQYIQNLDTGHTWKGTSKMN